MENPKSNNKMSRSQLSSFAKKYPILWNLIIICLCAFILIWVMLSWLDTWTLHGQEDTVPDVKGLKYDNAAQVLQREGMKAEITDSIFEQSIAPGTVVDQNPKESSKVKPGRTVYLTIVAFSPKLVAVPDFINASLRQGISIFEGLGISKIDVVKVESEYKDLVLGARYNGLPLQPGMRIPTTASIVIEVGSGHDDESEDSESLNPEI